MAGPALGVTISGKGIKETTSDLDAFRKSAAEAEKAALSVAKAETARAKATVDALRANKNATPAMIAEAEAALKVARAKESAARATVAATSADEKLARANRTTAGSMEKLAADTGKANGAMDRMNSTMMRTAQRLLTVAGAAAAIGGYIKLADAWSDMQSKVGAAVKDMQAAPDLMERMVDIANASYSPLTQTVEVYARNVGVLRDLGKTASEAADFTEALNNALVITATRGERAASVQDALSKAMAVGRLQADGLETILANGGRVAEALAAELNTNVNGLRAFASQGKITGAVIVNSLLNNFEALRAEAAEMPATVADGLTRIGTGLAAITGALENATGLTGGLAGALVSLGDVLAGTAEWINDNQSAITALGTVMAALAATQLARLAVGFYASATAMGVANLTTKALALSTTALSRAYALLGGPIGIAIGLVTAAWIEFGRWADNIDRVAESTASLKSAQEGMMGAMGALNANLTSETAAAAQAAIDNTRQAIADQMAAIETIINDAGWWTRAFGVELWETETVERYRAALATLSAEMDKLKGASKDLAATQAMIAKTGADVVENAQAWGAEAQAQMKTLMDRNALLQVEAQFGADSVQYQAEVARQSREEFAARVQALDTTEGMKAALMSVYDTNVQIESSIDRSASGLATAASNASRMTAELRASLGYLQGMAGMIASLGFSNVGQAARVAALNAGQSAAAAGVAGQLAEARAQLAETMRGGDMNDRRLALQRFAELEDALRTQLDLTIQEEAAMKRLSDASSAAGRAGTQAANDAKKAAEDALKELERRLDAVNDALSAARTPLQKFQDGLAELNKVAGYAKDAGIDFTQAYAHGMAELNDELLAAYPNATKFVDIMTDGLFDGFKNTLSSLRDMFRSWLKEMIATALKNQIVVPILTAMAGGGAGVAAGAAGSAGMFGAMGTGTGLAGLAGGTGFLGGVGNAIGGNMFAVGANAAAAGGGAMAAIGAAAVPVLAVVAAVSFLKKSTKELDSGMRVTVHGVDAMAESFRKVQTSRFWGLSKKTKTTYDGVAEETQAAISAAVANMQGGIMDMAHVLGVGASAFDDFAHVLTISTKGMTQDQALAEIQGKLAELGDSFASMIPGLDAQIRYGETATEALTRMSSSLVAVRDVVDLLGHSFKAAGIAGGALASSLADAFGGIDAMTGAVNAYFSAFYTEQEQIETATRRATAALASLGVAMPKTRAEYRAMIDALDLTNAASHATYAALINLSGVMDQILPSVADLTAELAQLQGSVATGLDGAIDAANAAAKANADAALNWYKASGSIRDWINKMRGTVSPLNSPAQARAANEAQYQIILARALAGDLDAARDVTGAADRLLASVSATARSQSEAAIVEARILADLTKLSVSSDIEGARHDIISGLLRRQADMMTTLRDYLAAGNALTIDMIDSFNKGMTDLDKGIAAAGKITYDSVSKTVPRILDLAGDTSAILSAVIGKDGKLQVGPITLGKMDAFSTWYESTTKAAVATPMADLRNAMTPLRTALDALRTALVAEGQRQSAAAKADADRQAKAAADAKKLANAEAKLANLASQRTSAVANLTKAANAINAFDEKTGGYLVNAQGKQEYATVNAKGQLEYAPTGVRNASSSALKQWQATYWADGGLEDQLLKANGAVLAVDRQLEAARAAIRALGGVPSFAGGGSTGNAPRTGGVDGMGGFPAILHPQEVVVDRTSDVFAELKDEIVRLRKEVQEFREQSRQIDMGIYDNGRKVANRINKWDVDGLPPERTPA